MKRVFLRRWPTVLISLITAGVITVWACAGGDWSGSDASVFTPEIINQPQFVPFFRTLESPFYNGYDDRQETQLENLNVQDWKKYLGEKVQDYEIRFWLYQSNLKQIDSMIFALKGKTQTGMTSRKRSSLMDCENPAKAKSFLFFTGFAKRNATFAPLKREYWEDEKEPTPITSADKQIAGGLALFNATKEPFLKERYAFQMVRLYYYTANYNSAVTFYNQNQKLFVSAHNLKWRAMGYKAAALYKLQKYSESNYLYSKIYEHFAPYKQSAYLSFHPQNDEEWEQTLKLAASNNEKEILWQLQGLYTNSIKAMREILKLNPKSEYVDLLLVRAVNIEEEKFSDYYGETSNNKTVDENLLTFLNEASTADYGHSPAVWNLAAAYLNYLKNDFITGDKQLAKAKDKCSGYLLTQQYNVISLAGKLVRIKKLDVETEKNITPEVKALMLNLRPADKDLRTNAIFNQLQKKLWNLFKQNGEWEKAECVWPDQQAPHFDSLVNIRKMINYLKRPEHSDIEKAFYSYNDMSKEIYMDLLAVKLVQHEELDEALTLLNSINNYERSLRANPFNIRIKDCHECDFELPNATQYTSKTFVQKLIEIKNTAKNKPAEAAQNYFLLANAFYNITYYGNGREFSNTRMYSGFNNYPDTVINGKQSDLALKYYLLAKQNSSNAEFRAKCAFMISKCELNRYYSNIGTGYEGDFKAGVYFDSLKTNYSKTKYYQEIIKECSYFRIYLGYKK